MGFYTNKKVLVTGGTGLIGTPLVEMLVKEEAKVRIASLDDSSRAHPKAEFVRTDLTNFDNCLDVCGGMDYVFHLAGIKGSPKMTSERPASIFDALILFNTNTLRAAKKANVKSYLYTSTIGVYAPAEVFHEDDVWSTFPSKNDWSGGWSKRMGELQVEAYRKEFHWDNLSIVRPANVYGRYDNFDPANSMVVPSLIKRAVDGENPLVVWGDGSPVRDFIHAEDVARGMMFVMEQAYPHPVNLGSGKGYSIKELVDVIVKNLDRPVEVAWDISKPSGDKKRLMDISRARELGWKPCVSLEDGVADVVRWYKENKGDVNQDYRCFDITSQRTAK